MSRAYPHIEGVTFTATFNSFADSREHIARRLGAERIDAFQFLCGFERSLTPWILWISLSAFNSFADSSGLARESEKTAGADSFQFLCGFERIAITKLQAGVISMERIAFNSFADSRRRMAAEYAERNFAFNSFADSSILTTPVGWR